MISRPNAGNLGKASFDHKIITVSCSTCHEYNRPLNSQFPHGDNQDCIKCHSFSLNTAGVRSWLNLSIYSHLPTPTSCMNCHESKRLSTHISNPIEKGMDKADCYNCHRSTNNWKNIINFDHEIVKPLSCVACHDSNVPNPTHPSSVGNYAKIDCYNCHNYLPTPKSWATIIFNYNNHKPDPTSCLICHKNVNDSLPLSNSHLTGSRSSLDCSSCHQFDLALKWKNYTKFSHILLSGAERCDGCHIPSNIAITSKPPIHVTTQLDCKSCHLTAAWKPASYVHSTTDTNCISCHITGSIGTPKPLSHTLNGQCSACHSQVNWTLSYNTTYTHTNHMIPISNGINHPYLSSCSICHVSTTDYVSWRYISVSTASTINPINTCAGCHLDKYAREHGILRTISNANCLSCHHTGYKW